MVGCFVLGFFGYWWVGLGSLFLSVYGWEGRVGGGDGARGKGRKGKRSMGSVLEVAKLDGGRLVPYFGSIQ